MGSQLVLTELYFHGSYSLQLEHCTAAYLGIMRRIMIGDWRVIN